MSKSTASSGPGKKNRRKRTSITGELLECLEMFYRKNSRPDRCERRQLAVEIGKPENLVRIWFQNRRAKQRRESQLLLKQMVPTIIVEPHQHNGKANSGGSKTLQTVLNNSNNNSSIDNKLVDSNDSITVGGTTTKNTVDNHQVKTLECSKCTEENSCTEHHQSPSSSSLQSLRLASQDEGSSQEFTTDNYNINSQASDVVPFILDSKLYSHVLKRIVGMVAAAESVLDETDPDFAEAILDATYGILLKGQKKLLYDEVFGLHVVDSP
ncbi:homeotic protein ocelliless-like isoform X1 [Octopus sinensis]|uniref:Homeotic protein ocelliless-like isoform X1 n=1 Tax=Octopus sinensis TaxID=2607531 RepID=A0A7E6FFQ4_9MOLL|nr:homeotic protein ocelliless-like isoform X1 [Octopus sinensis]